MSGELVHIAFVAQLDGQKRSAGNSGFGLLARYGRSMDSSRAEMGDGLLKFGQSSKGSRAMNRKITSYIQQLVGGRPFPARMAGEIADLNAAAQFSIGQPIYFCNNHQSHSSNILILHESL